MIAIILAAGRGARMAPLTDNIPKPMLSVLGKNLIEWKLEALPDTVTSIIILVGYKGEVIREYFGDAWNGIPITYITQTALNGTGGAIELCKDYIHDKALVMMGDDIYSKDDLASLALHNFALLAQDKGEEAGTATGGKIIARDGYFIGLNEGLSQTGRASTLINTGAYTLSPEYFTYEKVKVSDTEYGLPNTLVSVAHDHPVTLVQATTWIQITTPECLQRAEKILSHSH